MPTVTIDAKELPARLTEALKLVAGGFTVVVTDNGAEHARIVRPPRPEPAPKPRVPGAHPGSMVMANDFDAELPDEFWFGGNP